MIRAKAKALGKPFAWISEKSAHAIEQACFASVVSSPELSDEYNIPLFLNDPHTQSARFETVARNCIDLLKTIYPRLSEILEALPTRSPIVVLMWLTEPEALLDGAKPIQALLDNDPIETELAIRAAGRYGEMGS